MNRRPLRCTMQRDHGIIQLARGIASVTSRKIFHNIYYATFACRRPIKMSPACQLQMTLARGVPGGVWGGGFSDERSRTAAARGAAGFGSAAADARGGGAAARARTASGVSVVEGLSDRRSDRPGLEAPRSAQQPAQARGAATRGFDDYSPVVLGFRPDPGG